jgi:hypothetical protein
VRIYASIKVNLRGYQTFEYAGEINERLETARRTAKVLGEYGMQIISLEEFSMRGNAVYKKANGKDLPLGTLAQKEYAASIFENEIAKTEIRALAFLRAFEKMGEFFFLSVTDEDFIEKLAAEYKI